MFKFLFGGKKTPEVKPESNRERFDRLVGELNDLIDTLPQKPRVTFDPATGHVLPEAPEQFADEALALPAPDEAKAAAAVEVPAEDKAPAKPQANPAVTEGDAVASAAPTPTNATSDTDADAAQARQNGVA